MLQTRDRLCDPPDELIDRRDLVRELLDAMLADVAVADAAGYDPRDACRADRNNLRHRDIELRPR